MIGNPGTRRMRGMETALAGLGLPPPRVVPYAELLAERVHLSQVVTEGSVVRIESPDEQAEVQRAVLALGADPAEAERSPFRARNQIADAVGDKGRLLPARQWFLGFCAMLATIERQLAMCPPHRLMNVPADMKIMFDKRRCSAVLRAAGVPVPPPLDTSGVQDFDALVAAMRATGMARVFVKPAHGSSAAGVVAFQTNGREHLATTTVERADTGSEQRLYNSKRVRTYRGEEARSLLDTLCREPVHVERWLPKAGIDGKTFDLRVVVIGGQTRHTVARLSRTPLTNLHLDNERRGTGGVRARMGDEAWGQAMRTCERAMTLFPDSLYAGLDLLIGADFRRHAVLEMNAFGDLLLDTSHEGLDTYGWEALTILGDTSLKRTARPETQRALAPC